MASGANINGRTTTYSIGPGAAAFKHVSAATTNATVVKASAGVLYAIVVNNINAAARYLKLYNKATAPTVGTDTPVLVIPIPAASTVNLVLAPGVAFSAGIGIGLVTGIADSSTAAVAANEHVVSLVYV